MSILYDEGQQAIATESRKILDARVNKDKLLDLLEQTGAYDETFWKVAVEQGWTALPIAEDHGGLGLGLTEFGLVAQASGAATAGAPFLASGYGFAKALELSGDAAVQGEWLPRLAAGEIKAALAFGENGAPFSSAPAVTFADGKLSGTKHGVTGGLAADVALVWASQGGAPALALAALEGTTRTAIYSFDNSRLFADITFDGTSATLIASGDRAVSIARQMLAGTAVVIAHEQVGGAEALLHIARDYALTRRAFGQPIGAFQSIKHKIAEMYALVELARANCIHAAASEGSDGFLKAAASARLVATEAYDTAARDCTQIHGGIGVTWEQGLHLHMRRARSLAIELGNAFFWEDLLAYELTGEQA
jgi:acyl-CoA dehydrogenase